MLSAIVKILLKIFNKNKTEVLTKEPELDTLIFFSDIKSSLFHGKFNQDQIDGINYLLNNTESLTVPQRAYMLATAYHETAKTMRPIHERGGETYFTQLYDVKGKNPSRAKKYGNTRQGDGIKYHGRGYVQLTWKSNYKKMGDLLNIDLVNEPDLAVDPKIAVDVMVTGMKKGIFTGKKLTDYISGSKIDFVGARKIVNGTDKADLIATIAYKFKSAFEKSTLT